ncbi:tripartite tricarboxylate transporter permease [Rhizobium sp. PAMB 3182]
MDGLYRTGPAIRLHGTRLRGGTARCLRRTRRISLALGLYGGAIPAVLLRIPGTPAAVATTFDGYPMAQKGEGGFALQVAVVSSSIGGIASAIALMVLAPPLSKATLLFGP